MEKLTKFQAVTREASLRAADPAFNPLAPYRDARVPLEMKNFYAIQLLSEEIERLEKLIEQLRNGLTAQREQ